MYGLTNVPKEATMLDINRHSSHEGEGRLFSDIIRQDDVSSVSDAQYPARDPRENGIFYIKTKNRNNEEQKDIQGL
jgi:hypothetical protein